MDKVRQLVGADMPDSSIERKEGQQGESLLNRQLDAEQHSEQGSETWYSGARRPQRPWTQWMVSTVLFVLYFILLVAYLKKEPSELQCAEKLTVWCKYNRDSMHLT